MALPYEGQAHAAAQECPLARSHALAHFGADAVYQEVEQEAGGVGSGGHCCKGCLHWAAPIGAQQSCLHSDYQGRSHCIHS